MKSALLFLLCLSSCQSFIIDTSMSAAEAQDATLVHTAGVGPPSQGFDVLRVPEDSTITQNWTIIIPVKTNVVSGGLVIRFKDHKLSKIINSSTVVIPWKEIMGQDRWTKELGGVAQVTASVQYKTPTSDANFVDILGYTFIKVLPTGYSPLPIGSPLGAWLTSCKIAYSTNGRSNVDCKP